MRTNGSKLGKKIGNPTFTKIPSHIEARIVELRGHGLSYARIAETLNAEQVPTAQGGSCWHPQTVANVCKRTG